MATGASAAAAAIVKAVKASGVVVRLSPDEFMKIVSRAKEPLIVTTEGGIFSSSYKYLLSYKGLAFLTESGTPLTLPTDAELVEAEKFWMPG